MTEDLIVICDCSLLDHAVRFTTWTEDGFPDRSVDIVLRPSPNFWRRLHTAWRFLWQRTCHFGSVSSVAISDEDLLKIHLWSRSDGLG